ncbi:MAG: single-stranded-DNA-specific exonuclease RecJ, partial [Anaerocolumna sp.]
MKNQRFIIIYLGSIASKLAICKGTRLKNQRFFIIYLGSIASKLAICMGISMEKWFITTKNADFNKWAEEFHISPVLARIIRNRDITETEQVRKYLYGTLEDCHSPWLMDQMDVSVKLVMEAIALGKKIRIIGDYDVDGICSTVILLKGLTALNAWVDSAIPHRITDGYGLNEHLIQAAYEDKIDLIITCDNGIAASKQIQIAKELGMSVIVTDHHEVPYIEEDGKREQLLPPADGIINPHKEECQYPFKGICGGLVAYKFIKALMETAVKESAFVYNEELNKELLQFAAMATVCDIMELKEENRIIVKEGLKLIRQTNNEGMKALMEVNKIAPENIEVYHLGFVIGPCLNATGRLDSAMRSIELFNCADKRKAMTIAQELKELNENRKNMTIAGTKKAQEYIVEKGILEQSVYMIYLPDVHESLAGIIAGRIKESYHHPVFVLTKGEEGVKGSGRSIENYNMFEEMSVLKKYFTKFGGHKMAAGLSMREEDIDNFREEINQKCTLTKEDFVAKVQIDIALPFSYANETFVKELAFLEPYGMGNGKPLFAQKGMRLKCAQRIGAKQNYLKLFMIDTQGGNVEMMYFG